MKPKLVTKEILKNAVMIFLWIFFLDYPVIEHFGVLSTFAKNFSRFLKVQ